jgi:hypothetical protein
MALIVLAFTFGLDRRMPQVSVEGQRLLRRA